MSMNNLWYKDNPKTRLLKSDSRQFLCVPCSKLINADEAEKHLICDPHVKAVKVQETIIHQKLGAVGLTPNDMHKSISGQNVELPMVNAAQKVSKLAEKLQSISADAELLGHLRNEQDKAVQGLSDDLHLEAHFRFQLEKTVKQQEQKLKEQAQTLAAAAQALEWLRGTMQTKATREEVRNLFKAQKGDQDHLDALAEMWERHDEMWKVLHARRARKAEVAMARRPASKNRGQVDMS
eukprot:gene10165-8666_t